MKRVYYIPYIPRSVESTQWSLSLNVKMSEGNDSLGVNENKEQAEVNIFNSNRHFPKVNYPDFKIPTLSGSLETWLGFPDSFSSMIYNHPYFPMIQRFYYLKGCVTGETAIMIPSLKALTENYKVAWNLLKKSLS